MTSETAPPEWIAAHRAVWDAKPGLRKYYEKEYFERIAAAMPSGRSCELGSGPGFFTDYHRCTVVTDISPSAHIDRQVDVHQLPFDDESFSAVVGIDVFHHFENPMTALGEISRVLIPTGKLILIEPWTTWVGRLFYKHVHHEDCFPISEPESAAFPKGKDPMDGNAAIPRTYLETLRETVTGRFGFSIEVCEKFGLAAYLSTGGFTKLSTPAVITDICLAIDKITPGALRNVISLKAFIVASKC
ncbi:MAG: class I SAM-dependent methyltransferase [Gammaproteobacteria bacterium]